MADASKPQGTVAAGADTRAREQGSHATLTEPATEARVTIQQQPNPVNARAMTGVERPTTLSRQSTRRRSSVIGAGVHSDEGHAHDTPTSSPPPTPPLPPVERTITGGSARPYSAFSTKTKWAIAALGGTAAVFSPISSNIFVPAIPALSQSFHRSESDITQAVTVYLVCQAVTPSFLGAASDSFGRRPVFLATMVVYMGANIGLALMPTTAYWLLLFLRALQSTGGSAVISIGAGAVSDIASPRERGKFMSVFQCGAMLGPAMGPFLGGLFAQTLGWRSIFWFLTIATGCVLVPFLFFYPETLRSIVGDGSIPPPALNSSPIAIYQRRQAAKRGVEREHVERPPHKPYNPLSAFMILFTPEVLLIFIFVSLPYLEFYCVLTLLSTALKDKYGLGELMIGLCYLPGGAGTILSAYLNGQQADFWYKREERRAGGDFRKKPETFRVDITRIRCMYPFIGLFCTASIALGWCLQTRAHLAATLVMQFLMGLGTGTIALATLYGQDILPGKGGAVSASLNLVRCAFGAIGTAVVQKMYNTLGAGWTFVLLSGICLAGTPLSFIVIRYAPGWRAARARRAEQKRASGAKGLKERIRSIRLGHSSREKDSMPRTPEEKEPAREGDAPMQPRGEDNV